MGILERSKVRLTLKLDSKAYHPGEEITGTVHLDVKETITFCALRLHLKGRETIEVFVQRGTATMAVTDQITYANSWVTFTGPCKRSQSREKQTYEPGCYSYPFRLPLSPRLPPTFAVTTSSGRVFLQYVASVVLDIPNGFDAIDEVDFRILSVAPLHQVHLRSMPNAAVPSTQTASVCKHDWVCCLWGKRRDAAVVISASVAPGIVALGLSSGPPEEAASGTALPSLGHSEEDPSAPTGAPDAEPRQRNRGHSRALRAQAASSPLPVMCEAHIRLFNDWNKALPSLKVELTNVVRVQYGVHESYHTASIAKATVEDLNLAPQETRTVVVPLTPKTRSFRATMEDAINLPIPSLATQVVTSSYVLKVKFPGSKVEKDLSFSGLVDVVDAVSVMAGTLEVPSLFPPLLGLGTEVRYVAQPTTITFPADDERVYPTVHEPYWPRESDGAQTTEQGSVKEAEAVREVSCEAMTSRSDSTTGGHTSAPASHEGSCRTKAERGEEYTAEDRADSGRRRHSPVSPVLAMPVPGHIIQGSVLRVESAPPSRER